MRNKKKCNCNFNHEVKRKKPDRENEVIMKLELNQRKEKEKSILKISTLYNVDDSNDVNLSDLAKDDIATEKKCIAMKLLVCSSVMQL